MRDAPAWRRPSRFWAAHRSLFGGSRRPVPGGPVGRSSAVPQPGMRCAGSRPGARCTGSPSATRWGIPACHVVHRISAGRAMRGSRLGTRCAGFRPGMRCAGFRSATRCARSGPRRIRPAVFCGPSHTESTFAPRDVVLHSVENRGATVGTPGRHLWGRRVRPGQTPYWYVRVPSGRRSGQSTQRRTRGPERTGEARPEPGRVPAARGSLRHHACPRPAREPAVRKVHNAWEVPYAAVA